MRRRQYLVSVFVDDVGGPDGFSSEFSVGVLVYEGESAGVHLAAALHWLVKKAEQAGHTVSGFYTRALFTTQGPVLPA